MITLNSDFRNFEIQAPIAAFFAVLFMLLLPLVWAHVWKLLCWEWKSHLWFIQVSFANLRANFLGTYGFAALHWQGMVCSLNFCSNRCQGMAVQTPCPRRTSLSFSQWSMRALQPETWVTIQSIFSYFSLWLCSTSACNGIDMPMQPCPFCECKDSSTKGASRKRSDAIQPKATTDLDPPTPTLWNHLNWCAMNVSYRIVLHGIVV